MSTSEPRSVRGAVCQNENCRKQSVITWKGEIPYKAELVQNLHSSDTEQAYTTLFHYKCTECGYEWKKQPKCQKCGKHTLITRRRINGINGSYTDECTDEECDSLVSWSEKIHRRPGPRIPKIPKGRVGLLRFQMEPPRCQHDVYDLVGDGRSCSICTQPKPFFAKSGEEVRREWQAKLEAEAPSDRPVEEALRIIGMIPPPPKELEDLIGSLDLEKPDGLLKNLSNHYRRGAGVEKKGKKEKQGRTVSIQFYPLDLIQRLSPKERRKFNDFIIQLPEENGRARAIALLWLAAAQAERLYYAVHDDPRFIDPIEGKTTLQPGWPWPKGKRLKWIKTERRVYDSTTAIYLHKLRRYQGDLWKFCASLFPTERKAANKQEIAIRKICGQMGWFWELGREAYFGGCFGICYHKKHNRARQLELAEILHRARKLGEQQAIDKLWNIAIKGISLRHLNQRFFKIPGRVGLGLGSSDFTPKKSEREHKWLRENWFSSPFTSVEGLAYINFREHLEGTEGIRSRLRSECISEYGRAYMKFLEEEEGLDGRPKRIPGLNITGRSQNQSLFDYYGGKAEDLIDSLQYRGHVTTTREISKEESSGSSARIGEQSTTRSACYTDRKMEGGKKVIVAREIELSWHKDDEDLGDTDSGELGAQILGDKREELDSMKDERGRKKSYYVEPGDYSFLLIKKCIGQAGRRYRRQLERKKDGKAVYGILGEDVPLPPEIQRIPALEDIPDDELNKVLPQILEPLLARRNSGRSPRRDLLRNAVEFVRSHVRFPALGSERAWIYGRDSADLSNLHRKITDDLRNEAGNDLYNWRRLAVRHFMEKTSSERGVLKSASILRHGAEHLHSYRTSAARKARKLLDGLAQTLESKVRDRAFEYSPDKQPKHIDKKDVNRLKLVLSDCVTPDEIRRAFRKIYVEDVQRRVAEHFGMSVQQLKSSPNREVIASPRQVAMYLAHKLTSASLLEIGIDFDKSDYSSLRGIPEKERSRLIRDAADALSRVESLCEEDKWWARLLRKLKRSEDERLGSLGVPRPSYVARVEKHAQAGYFKTVSFETASQNRNRLEYDKDVPSEGAPYRKEKKSKKVWESDLEKFINELEAERAEAIFCIYAKEEGELVETIKGDERGYQIGQTVRHERYGSGRVISKKEFRKKSGQYEKFQRCPGCGRPYKAFGKKCRKCGRENTPWIERFTEAIRLKPQVLPGLKAGDELGAAPDEERVYVDFLSHGHKQFAASEAKLNTIDGAPSRKQDTDERRRRSDRLRDLFEQERNLQQQRGMVAKLAVLSELERKPDMFPIQMISVCPEAIKRNFDVVLPSTQRAILQIRESEKELPESCRRIRRGHKKVRASQALQTIQKIRCVRDVQFEETDQRLEEVGRQTMEALHCSHGAFDPGGEGFGCWLCQHAVATHAWDAGKKKVSIDLRNLERSRGIPSPPLRSGNDPLPEIIRALARMRLRKSGIENQLNKWQDGRSLLHWSNDLDILERVAGKSYSVRVLRHFDKYKSGLGCHNPIRIGIIWPPPPDGKVKVSLKDKTHFICHCVDKETAKKVKNSLAKCSTLDEEREAVAAMTKLPGVYTTPPPHFGKAALVSHRCVTRPTWDEGSKRWAARCKDCPREEHQGEEYEGKGYRGWIACDTCGLIQGCRSMLTDGPDRMKIKKGVTRTVELQWSAQDKLGSMLEEQLHGQALRTEPKMVEWPPMVEPQSIEAFEEAVGLPAFRSIGTCMLRPSRLDGTLVWRSPIIVNPAGAYTTFLASELTRDPKTAGMYSHQSRFGKPGRMLWLRCQQRPGHELWRPICQCTDKLWVPESCATMNRDVSGGKFVPLLLLDKDGKVNILGAIFPSPRDNEQLGAALGISVPRSDRLQIRFDGK